MIWPEYPPTAIKWPGQYSLDELCAQNSAPAISPGQKWWLTVLEIEISCSQWEGSVCTQEWSSFFLLGEGGRAVIFCFFPCSHEVSKVFPDHSQFVPNSTWVLSPKFNSPVYKLKRWKGAHLFLFCNRGPKRCFYWGHAQCSKKIADGPINMAPLK